MERKNAILVVEDKESKLFEGIQKIQGEVETEKTGYSEIHETLNQFSPHVVIFNLDHEKERVKEILDTYSDKHPHTYWALSAREMKADELVDFMRRGVSDFINQPLTPADFEGFLHRIENWDARHLIQEKHQVHSVYSFFSCKGGVGLSFIAANTAVAMAKRNLGRVLLADFVLQHGNTAELLDLAPHYTLVDLMENLERTDSKLLENSLQKHRSGVFVLPASKQLENAEPFPAKDTVDVLKIFKRTFNYTLVDAGHEFNTLSLATLDISNQIFVVTTPDLPSICNAKSALETFKKLGYKEDKVKLLLNRWHMKGEIECPVIEKNLDYPIFHKITDDPLLSLNSVNQGIPLHELSKNAEIVKSLDKFVERISTEAKKEERHDAA